MMAFSWLLAGAVVAAAGDVAPRDGYLLDLKDGLSDADVQDLAQEYGLSLRGNSIMASQDRLYLAGDELAGALQRLKEDGRVEAVEPNHIYTLPETWDAPAPVPEDGKLPKGFPDDPMFKSQWHMTMINMPEAWKKSQGKGSVVAVIDTGVSDGKGKYPRVPDLEGTHFVAGYDFIHDNNHPDDDHAHGTHVAGTIAQRTHNGFGVAGVAPQASIMPLKVLSKQGSGTAGDIAEAIRWAADHGAHVINMSLGGGGYSDVMARAVKYAHDKGVVVVCAAGNNGRARVEFPAAYPGALAVSAVGPDGKMAWYSSYGKEVFVAAPGGDTRVDLNGDGIADGVLQDTIAVGDPNRHGFFPFQGTSMATPHVAGLAALVRAQGVTNPDAVARIIGQSAEKRDDKMRYGNGLINAAAAVKAAEAPATTRLLTLGGLLFVVAAFARRRLGSAAVKLGAGGLVAAVLAGVGVFPLMGVDLPFANVLASPLPAWGGALLGEGPSALLASAALPLLASVLLLGVGRLRGVLLGLATGTAAFLMSEAFVGVMDIRLIPGAGMMDSAWLLINGVLTLLLAVLLTRR